MIENKKILIIGGTGALGRTLTNRYLTHAGNKIKILSRDEQKHVTLMTSTYKDTPNVSFIIGDVKDKNSLTNAIETFKPHIVINTAALKHVHICETNSIESVKVNILGNQNLIDVVQSANHRIETLIFVSTDKACKPLNIYGMCKSISERLYIDFSKKQTDIKVCLVRFGNLLESTGSVIPFFKKLLESGAKYLPITDKRMTRFLISLNQAVDVIDWAYNTSGTHGKIAIPNLKSFLITDVAKVLINSYLGSEDSIPLSYIGIRKGEKLHEEMISTEEWFRTEEREYFLIGDEIIRNDTKSYNSLDYLMNKEDVEKFFKEQKVI